MTKSRWVQEVRYLETEGAIEICFTRSVVQAITRLDGAEEFYPVFTKPNRQFNERFTLSAFMSYLFNGNQQGKTPVFELALFRGQMGLEDGEYTTMSNFKKRVLDLAVNEVNEKTDIDVSYTQQKRGRAVYRL